MLEHPNRKTTAQAFLIGFTFLVIGIFGAALESWDWIDSLITHLGVSLSFLVAGAGLSN